MSDGPDLDAPVETIVTPPRRDLGDGFVVMRALPNAARRMVGPFVFLDEMGPVTLGAGRGLDVRPHPHIGLATVTYLLEGEILHRDSLGSVQPIRPGDINWMTAGRGIVHSERSPPGARDGTATLHGLQCWVGLPQALEETEPLFRHTPAAAFPTAAEDGVRLRVVAGALLGLASPLETVWPTLFVEIGLAPGARLALPHDADERALYLIEGALAIAGTRHEAGHLLVLRPGVTVDVRAETACRLVLLGGTPLDGARHLWWNFVSSSKDRIEAAKADWRERRFDLVPGETEFIPLPA